MGDLLSDKLTRRESNILAPHWSKIVHDFQAATRLVDDYLPVADVTYFACYRPRMWSPVGGHAPAPHEIYLSFNPAADPKYDRQILFPIYLAHERVHTLQHRGRGYADGNTIGGRIISEGQATVSEDEMARRMGLEDHPLSEIRDGERCHAYALSSKMLAQSLVLASRQKNLSVYNKANFDIYCVGHHVVSTYMKQNGITTVLDTLSIPAHEILAATFG